MDCVIVITSMSVTYALYKMKTYRDNLNNVFVISNIRILIHARYPQYVALNDQVKLSNG